MCTWAYHTEPDPDEELAQGHDRNLSFHLPLVLSLKTKGRITHLSLLLLYCNAGETRLL